ncbi:MAG: ATP-binding cassette domain-containing protein, partial [Thermoanaerobaculia bacterium]
MTAPLAAVGLAAGYAAGDVLTDVTRTFEAGRVTALLGENGAGKSTLLKALAGILPLRRGSV